MTLLALLLIILGFIHLSASTRASFKVFFGRGRPQTGLRNWLHIVGYMYLIAALLPCMSGWNFQMAIVVWLGLLHVGAVGVTLMLTYSPGLVRRLWLWGCLGRLGKPFLPKASN
ncbi:MAG: hypothetical protein CSH37_14460 [Thalassolituus sp.]|nr:MAG: hypothetical protein CSH37_14460 [Thalassolituus sp.]